MPSRLHHADDLPCLQQTVEGVSACPPTKAAARIPTVLFGRALVGLLLFDLLRLCHSFNKLHRFVTAWRVASQTAPSDMVSRVSSAVNRACIWYPKRVLCLQRSAVTTCLLRSCGVSATMVIGVQSLPFKAHAWSEVNGNPINERREVQRFYTVLERL